MTTPPTVRAWAGRASGRLEWWHQAVANVRAVAQGLPEPVADRRRCPHCGKVFASEFGVRIHAGVMHRDQEADHR